MNTNSQAFGHRISSTLQRALRSPLAARLSYPYDVDTYLQALLPRWSVNEVRAQLVETYSQTADTVTVRLRPNRTWDGFAAGQFVQLSVNIDGVRHTRCFSPANAENPEDGLIELSCKIGPGSLVSRYLRDVAQPGLVLSLSQAQGQFALPGQRPERVLLISGGSGITPVLAMLRTLCAEDHPGQITFLHYCNSVADQLYAVELETMAARHPNVQLLRCYSQPGQGGELEGLFSAEQLQKAVPDFAQAETFLCGPPGMMDAVQEVFTQADLGDRLHLEHFASPVTQPAESTNPQGDLHFAHSERAVANDGDTLLNQAEAAGLRPAAGCRMGICYSCTCRKTAGQVRDLRTGKLSGTGEEDIQICVSVPVGTVALDI